MANSKKLAILLFVALLLRFISINQSLWLDEAISAIAARDFSYSEIIAKFIVVDNHTPGYYLLLKFWTNMFGSSEMALRSLSVFFGLATVFVVFRINKVAALLLATSQLHIYYSQETRMYAMAAFFGSIAVLYFIKALTKNKNFHWVMFSLAILGMMVSDYMPVFLLPIFPIFVFVKKRKLFKKIIISFIPLGIFGMLWLPVMQTQIANYSEIPKDFLFGGATVKQAVLLWMKFVFGRLSFEPKILYYFLVVLASIPVLVALSKSLKGKNLLFWLWLLFPPISAFLVSFIFPAFSYFRFIYILPTFYILIAQANKKLLVYFVLFFNLMGLFIYYTDENQQREQWRQAVNFVEKKPSSDAIALFEFPDPFAPYRWYSKGTVKAAGATNLISAGEASRDLTRELIKNKKKIYYFEYLRDISDPAGHVQFAILANGFKETFKTSEFVGVGAVTIYEKNN